LLNQPTSAAYRARPIPPEISPPHLRIPKETLMKSWTEPADDTDGTDGVMNVRDFPVYGLLFIRVIRVIRGRKNGSN
jgi:hypothetical protein